MAVLIASLSIIEEKEKLYANGFDGNKFITSLAYQQTLEHMLKREKAKVVESKKRSMAVSQK